MEAEGSVASREGERRMRGMNLREKEENMWEGRGESEVSHGARRGGDEWQREERKEKCTGEM